MVSLGMKTPMVSVIIPTWNRQNTIGKCLESVLNQTYKDYEIIVADDGSTDETVEIVQKYADKHENIILLELKNNSKTPAVPRNRAFEKSSGKWIAFLDSDDYWLPNKLEIQMAFIYESSNDNRSIEAVATNANTISSNGENHGKYINLKADHKSKFFFVHDETVSGGVKSVGYTSYIFDYHFLTSLKNENPIITSSVIVSRKLFEDVKGMPEEISARGVEDFTTWVKISMFTDWFVIDDPMLNYTYDSQNSMRSTVDISKLFSTQRIITFKNLLNVQLEFINKYRSDLKIKLARARLSQFKHKILNRRIRSK